MKKDKVLKVTLPGGRVGCLEGGRNALTAAQRIRGDVKIALEDGECYLVPARALAEQPEGTFLLQGVRLGTRRSTSSLEAVGGEENLDDQTAVIPVLQEEVLIRKRERVTGIVRVHTTVHEDEVLVDEPLRSERVEIVRVPVNRAVKEMPAVRDDGDVVIIPVVEEVLVVEKRLVVREEIHLKRIREERHEPQTVRLRHEEVKIERDEGNAANREQDLH